MVNTCIYCWFKIYTQFSRVQLTPAFGAGARSAEVPAHEVGEQHELVRLFQALYHN